MAHNISALLSKSLGNLPVIRKRIQTKLYLKR
jgi:hypothetical protein